MNRKYWSMIISLIATFACNEPKSNSNPTSVVGVDERQEDTIESAYTATVGALLTPHGTCTGFVTGPRELTTAAHCLGHDPFAANLAAFDFELAHQRGHSHLSKVIMVNGDIATIELESEFRIYLEKASFSKSADTKLVSYERKRDILLQSGNCATFVDDNNYIGHQCDTEGGSSGSPIIQDGHAVGVHVGYQAASSKNVGQLFMPLESIETARPSVFQHFNPEISCSDNCEDNCRRRVAGQPFVEPICYSACNVEKGFACAKEKVEADVIGSIMPKVREMAQRDGWTKTNCVTVGTPIVVLASAELLAPACLAAGAATIGWGLPACITGVSGAIVGLVCTQLCQDRQLLDCKE